jgi:hypothetical protein
MQRPELKKIKHKRILMFYDELTSHKIDYQESLKFMSYVFGVSQGYITVILKSFKLTEFTGVKLEHWDLDLKMIDSYALKLYAQAKKMRNITQISLELA